MSNHDHTHHHDHSDDEGEIVIRVKALEALLVEKGLVNSDAIDALIDVYENKVGPHVGANVVAHAWTDPEYKRLLLTDGNAALAKMGVTRLQGEDMIIVENTDKIHNVIVCTLCSCYPWGVLGLPPSWYKATPYRARVVREPRAVLKEFGLNVPTNMEVQVWDSNAELRYMVLPRRPKGTEGMSEEQLKALVTRDSLIGVSDPLSPNA